MANVGLVVDRNHIQQTIETLRQNNPQCLAPLLREATEGGLTALQIAGVDAISFECCRCNELAEIYFEEGASKSPNAYRTWHFYGLARDIISKSKGWDVYPHKLRSGAWYAGDAEWLRAVCTELKGRGLKWGGDWVHFQDYPHWQWGKCRPSPSDIAVMLFKTKGTVAIWREVGAIAA